MGQDAEIILLKQLASCLRIPIAIVDPDATVVYFNEPAEAIFGMRFEETGALAADEWTSLLQPSDGDHVPLKEEDRPLATALEQRVPSHRRVHVRTSEAHNQARWEAIEVTGVPLTAVGDRFLGALSLFWRAGMPVPAETADPADLASQQAVETILTRRLAATWTAPIFLVDPDGRLLYFNPAAEPILGRPFDGKPSIENRRELYGAFQPRDEAGNPIRPEDHPLAIARQRREPVHRMTWIRGLDGNDRRIEITAIPLIGQSDQLVGAFGVFWESQAS